MYSNLVDRAAQDRRLTMRMLHVLDAILRAAGDEGATRITVSAIAQYTRLHERTVTRALKRLQDTGYIARRHRSRKPRDGMVIAVCLDT